MDKNFFDDYADDEIVHTGYFPDEYFKLAMLLSEEQVAKLNAHGFSLDSNDGLAL